MVNTVSTQLFGGAITAVYPRNLTDASDLRQVPDTQEVYLSNDSDLSLILEVLQLVTDDGAGESLEAAIKYHYSCLAHDNEAFESNISSTSLPTPTPPPAPPIIASTTSHQILGPTTLSGTQLVSKFNKPRSEADIVSVQMALWRIPSKGTDLVLTVNYPLGKSGTARDSDGEKMAQEAFQRAVETLRIVDFGLFAGEGGGA